MSPTRRSTVSRRRRRRGFALAEVVVALAMLAVGLLALAGSTAALLRADSAARATAGAAGLIADRVERVTAAACGAAGGTRLDRAYEERWQTVAADDGYTLVDSVAYADPVAGRVVVG